LDLDTVAVTLEKFAGITFDNGAAPTSAGVKIGHDFL
jgi:hypothetical protein